MNFNVPAVDYPIGPDKMLTPKDPRTINDGVCAWDAALMRVLCGGSGLYHEVLNNIDFCGSKIGKAPVYLYANSGPQAGSTLTITNSYFCLQPDPRGTGGFGQLKIGFGPPSHWSIIYKNNQCDGASSNLTTGFCIDDLIDAPGTSIDMEYNAFTHQVVARVGGGVTNAAWIFKYNFVEGLNDINNPLSPHGEVMEMNCSGNRGGCNSSQSYEGNFLIWDPPTVAGMNNTTFFPSDGAPDKVTLSSVRIVNNVVVANAGGGGTIPAVDQVLMTVNSVKTLGNVTITGNWIDASGTGSGCSIIGDKSTQGTVTAQQSGTVINITSTGTGFRNLPIEPGWQFWRGGIREATITSMGTNRGKTGTVNVDTSANIPSDSSWTLVPGWNSLTQAGNMLLNDPSRTGSPTAMTISGPAMIGAPCF